LGFRLTVAFVKVEGRMPNLCLPNNMLLVHHLKENIAAQIPHPFSTADFDVFRGGVNLNRRHATLREAGLRNHTALFATTVVVAQDVAIGNEAYNLLVSKKPRSEAFGENRYDTGYG